MKRLIEPHPDQATSARNQSTTITGNFFMVVSERAFHLEYVMKNSHFVLAFERFGRVRNNPVN
jgi:hypothetical protein